MRTRSLLSFLIVVVAGCGGDGARRAPTEPGNAQQLLGATPADVDARLGPALAPLVDESWAALDATHGPEQIAIELARALAETALRGARLGELLAHHPLDTLRAHVGEGEPVVRFLRARVLDDAHLEGEGVWRVTGAGLCGPRCAAVVESLALRVYLELRGQAGLRAELRGGAAGAVLGSATLDPRHLVVEVSLDAVRALLADVVRVPWWPTTLEGTLRLELATQAAPLALHAAVALPSGLSVRVPLGGGDVEVRVAAADPLVSADATAADGTLRAAVAASAIDVGVPLGGAHLSVAVPGATGGVVIASGSGVIALEQLGLGDTTTVARLGNAQIVGVDLGAATGRRLGVAIRLQDVGLPRIDAAPSLDLAIALHLLPLVALGEDIPSFLRDETYRVLAEGPPSVQPVLERGLGLAVRTGRIDVSSTAAADHVVATAGQILLLGGPAAPGQHPLLGRLRVVGP